MHSMKWSTQSKLKFTTGTLHKNPICVKDKCKENLRRFVQDFVRGHVSVLGNNLSVG